MNYNYRIVCVTPAGRRRYLRYLIPQIISSSIVDRYDIWVNTIDTNDLLFLEKISKKYPKIRLIPQPEGEIVDCASVCAFLKLATDVDTIYIRLDDDIVWIEPNFFQKNEFPRGRASGVSRGMSPVT
ncbi:MAG: hypothetical protein ABI425_06185 [Patescibacteria group bacterium]